MAACEDLGGNCGGLGEGDHGSFWFEESSYIETMYFENLG